LDTFAEADEPVLTAVEIADRFDVTRAAANERLKALLAEGELHRKTVGSRAVVWWCD
jgi:Fic family protein